MPGKHVRFARNNTVHTFPQATLQPPPLTHSSHSPASTISLLTPPDHPSPLPSVSSRSKHLAPPMQRSHSIHHSSSIQLHPLLEMTSHPELVFDVRQPLSRIGSKRRVITPEEFSDPATSPRMSSMTITHKYLSWSIHVRPSGYSRSREMQYVTVWDVLSAIYTSLGTGIEQREYDGLGNGSRHQNRVRKAYEDRYRMLPRGSSAYQEEKLGGVRRVDFLVEYVKFKGLTPHDVRRGEYTLHTDH